MFESFLHLRKSRGQSCEFLCACVTRGQQRRNNVSTFFSDDVTVRVRDFCDQAMRAQQPQATSHRRHFSALLLFVLGRRVEMETQVTIAKPVERKFPTIDDRHQFSVALPQWIKRSVTVSVPPYGPADLRGLLGEPGLHMDCSQSGQVSLGGCPTDFRAAMKVRDAAAQFAPALRASRTFLRRAKAAEISRFINRGLNAQDTALVIAFKRVFIDPVLDPYAVRPATPIALHVLETYLCRAVHKPQHLFTAKGHHGVVHQGGINACKSGPVTKHHISCVLGLGRRPVVVTLNGTANLSVQRMALLEQRPQKYGPVGAVLLIHQRLGTRHIANPRKTVVLSLIAKLRLIHLAGQPFSSVETNLNQKRKPALQPKVQKSQLFMHPVKVQVDALAPFKSKLKLSGETIAAQKPGAARLDATKHSNKPQLNLVTLLDLSSLILLACATGVKIKHRPVMPRRQIHCRLAHTSRQRGGEGFKIFPQNSCLPQVLFHHRLVIETSKRALQSQSIPTVQNSDDIACVTSYKGMRNLFRQCIVYRRHEHRLHQ